MTFLTVTLPAIEIPAVQQISAAGVIEIPGMSIVEKKIDLDPKLIQQLITAARTAAKNAYAPYSKFHVGAALVMADDPNGQVFCGANIENSSYGVTNCGERTALFQATAAGFRQIKYMALSTLSSLAAPLGERSPCGVCRQALKEFTLPDDNLDQALFFIDRGEEDHLCDILDMARLLPYGFNFAPPKEA